MLNENCNRKQELDDNRENDVLNMTASENDLREWNLDTEVFKNLFETMAEGVVYHNSTGKIIAANPAAERILGLTLSHMQERSPTDPGWKMIHEDGTPIPGEEYPVIKALKTGKPVYGKIIGFYPPKEKKEHWLKINAIPQYRKGEEEPYQVYTSFEDITQEIETQRALKQSQNELKRSLQEKDKQKRHLEAMHEIAVDVLDSADFLETATKLFNDCKKLTGATSGYVSLLQEAGDENEVIYLDSGGDDCTVDPTLPMPTRGLRGVAFHSGEAEYHNDFMNYTQTALAKFSKDIQIIAAENGEEAYHQYKEHKPDLILMDIVMPESDGYQATKKIRKLDAQVPIIAITAMVQKEDKEACLSAGMNEYISKPIYLAQLKEILKKHL